MVGSRQNIAFDIDPDMIDIAGSDIEVDATGSVFTINRAGLYHVEWSINLETATEPVVLCLLENGEPSSLMSNVAISGNHSSGALINVTDADLPYSVSLHNFGGAITITDPNNYEDTAASIRILRFADGPTP